MWHGSRLPEYACAEGNFYRDEQDIRDRQDFELGKSRLDDILVETIGRLEAALGELCGGLVPFPAFMGMATIQAVELEPALNPKTDRGCVVVTPDGMIAELDVTAIPGVVGVLEVDQAEEFKPLEDLSPEEYVIYLVAAVRALSEEARRRGG